MLPTRDEPVTTRRAAAVAGSAKQVVIAWQFVEK